MPLLPHINAGECRVHNNNNCCCCCCCCRGCRRSAPPDPPGRRRPRAGAGRAGGIAIPRCPRARPGICGCNGLPRSTGDGNDAAAAPRAPAWRRGPVVSRSELHPICHPVAPPPPLCGSAAPPSPSVGPALPSLWAPALPLRAPAAAPVPPPPFPYGRSRSSPPPLAPFGAPPWVLPHSTPTAAPWWCSVCLLGRFGPPPSRRCWRFARARLAYPSSALPGWTLH